MTDLILTQAAATFAAEAAALAVSYQDGDAFVVVTRSGNVIPDLSADQVERVMALAGQRELYEAGEVDSPSVPEAALPARSSAACARSGFDLSWCLTHQADMSQERGICNAVAFPAGWSVR